MTTSIRPLSPAPQRRPSESYSLSKIAKTAGKVALVGLAACAAGHLAIVAAEYYVLATMGSCAAVSLGLFSLNRWVVSHPKLVFVALGVSFAAVGVFALGGTAVMTAALLKEVYIAAQLLQWETAMTYLFFASGSIGYGLPYISRLLQNADGLINDEERRTSAHLHPPFSPASGEKAG